MALTRDTTSSFRTLLLWGQLAAANVRSDPFCIEEHRQALLLTGEPEQRIDQIATWQVPNLFSGVERSVFALSEAISVDNHAERMEDALFEAGRFFSPKEIEQLSTSVMAVNQWIDLHGKKPVRVIVVEDNADDQELLGRQFRKTEIGEHVLFLSDPKSALHLFRGAMAGQLRKSLVALFLDIHLPQMSGIDLLRSLRSLEAWESFPVIMMSTDNSPQNIAACADLNVTAFVTKPLTVASFANAVAPLFHQPVPA